MTDAGEGAAGACCGAGKACGAKGQGLGFATAFTPAGAVVFALSIPQWCAPSLRQHAGRFASLFACSEASDAKVGKLESISSSMATRERTA